MIVLTRSVSTAEKSDILIGFKVCDRTVKVNSVISNVGTVGYYLLNSYIVEFDSVPGLIRKTIQRPDPTELIYVVLIIGLYVCINTKSKCTICKCYPVYSILPICFCRTNRIIPIILVISLIKQIGSADILKIIYVTRNTIIGVRLTSGSKSPKLVVTGYRISFFIATGSCHIHAVIYSFIRIIKVSSAEIGIGKERYRKSLAQTVIGFGSWCYTT